MTSIRRLSGLTLAALILPTAATGAGPPDAVPLLEVRGVRPDAVVGSLIRLFEGSKAPHPAAALAAWKNAGGPAADLGKPLEALIAALNPTMLPEYEALDGATFRADVSATSGAVRWRLLIPRDDGRFGEFARALALTDGALLDQADGRQILRVGPGDAPVAFGPPGPLALASDTETLLAPQPRTANAPPDSPPPGWYARLDPAGLRRLENLRARQAGEALDALGVRDLSTAFRLAGETLELDVRSRRDDPGPTPSVEPGWIDALPPSDRIALVSFGWESGPAAVGRAFDLADRVDRADPARANLAPLRVRLNLVATAAGVNPEAELWPFLRGVSACLLFDPEGLPRGGLIGLHTRSAGAASRVDERLIPRVAAAFFRAEPTREGPADRPTRRLGAFEGLPVLAAVRGETVWISWGAAALAEGPDADPSSRPRSPRSAALGPGPLRRFGLFWPGALAGAGIPLAGPLRDAPKVVWKGRDEGEFALDTFRWEGLRGSIRRGLESVPLRPPHDRPDDLQGPQRDTPGTSPDR